MLYVYLYNMLRDSINRNDYKHHINIIYQTTFI